MIAKRDHARKRECQPPHTPCTQPKHTCERIHSCDQRMARVPDPSRDHRSMRLQLRCMCLHDTGRNPEWRCVVICHAVVIAYRHHHHRTGSRQRSASALAAITTVRVRRREHAASWEVLNATATERRQISGALQTVGGLLTKGASAVANATARSVQDAFRAEGSLSPCGSLANGSRGFGSR